MNFDRNSKWSQNVIARRIVASIRHGGCYEFWWFGDEVILLLTTIDDENRPRSWAANMSEVGDEKPRRLLQVAKLKTRSKKFAALQKSPTTTRSPQSPLNQSVTSFSSSSSSSSSVGASSSDAENNEEAVSSAAEKIRDAGRGSVKGGILDATKAQLEFLEKRKIAAAILRQFREVEVEKDPMQLLCGRYLPPVFQGATTVNRCRYQVTYLPYTSVPAPIFFYRFFNSICRTFQCEMEVF